MTKLGLDYETFSETDIKCGLDRYSNCPSTEVLMLGWAFDDDDPQLWLPHIEPMPKDLKDAFTLPGVEKRAWNATFEILMTMNVLGMEIDLNQWIDPMIMAHYCSLPGSLDRAGRIIRLPEEMLKMADEGKRLIKMFSMLQKPTKKQPLERLGWWTHPEDFDKFGGYCRQDVVTERAIWKRLRKYQLPEHEWDNWRLDFKINQRGYPIEAAFARSASKAFVHIQREIVESLNEVTGLSNSKSTEQMSKWVRERGYKRTNMQKDNVKKAVRDDDLDPLVVGVLQEYQKARSTNPTKYQSILKIIGTDSRARNSMQFMGAQRTHREAGRTVQFQNISRPSKPFEDFEYAAQARRDVMEYPPGMLKMLYDDPMDTIVSLIRSTIKAPEGRQLAVADLASIENVMIGFLARCEKTLGEFRDGKDPYLAFAVYLFDMPYDKLLEEVKNGDKSKRTLAKPGKLGAGYRLGGGDIKANGDKTGLWGYAENLGVEMTQAEAKRSIDVFREQYPAIVEMWYELESACKRVITGAAEAVQVGYMTVDAKGPFMRICMPSGSHLHYLRPKIEEKKTPWGAMRATITYEGVDQYTGKWTRLMTHGGKLVENCIAEGTEVLTDRGWVAIENITTEHLVHDGLSFVTHSGLLYKSVEKCITVDGVYMTSDHEVLTDDGWKTAQQNPRPYRPKIRFIDSDTPGRVKQEETQMGIRLPMWHSMRERGGRSKESSKKGLHPELRLYYKETNRPSKPQTRHGSTPPLLDLAQHESTVYEPESPSIQKLRRAWDYSLRRMDGFLSVLSRRFKKLPARFATGSEKQRRGLFSAEFSVGRNEGQQQEQKKQYLDQYEIRQGHSFGSCGAERRKRDHDTISVEDRLAGGPVARKTEKVSKVYDIMNCGPNNRFVVRGQSGPIIVHNCTQKAARDVLFCGLQEAEKAGLMTCGHVHDEIIAEVDYGDEAALQKLIDAMVKPPWWAPDLPLNASGYLSDFYTKD